MSELIRQSGPHLKAHDFAQVEDGGFQGWHVGSRLNALSEAFQHLQASYSSFKFALCHHFSALQGQASYEDNS